MNEAFWSGCSGGDADAFGGIKHVREDIGDVVDEESACAGGGGGFAEAVGVGAFVGADDEDGIGEGSEFSDGVLTVGGGVADIATSGDIGEVLFERSDGSGGFRAAEGGLGEVGDLGVNGDVPGGELDVVFVLNHECLAVELSAGSDDLGVGTVSDDKDDEAASYEFLAFAVDAFD